LHQISPSENHFSNANITTGNYFALHIACDACKVALRSNSLLAYLRFVS